MHDENLFLEEIDNLILKIHGITKDQNNLEKEQNSRTNTIWLLGF